MMKTTTTVSAVMAACAVIAAEVRYDGDDKAVEFAAADARKVLSGAKGEVGFAIDPTLAHQEWRLVAKDGRLTIYGRDGLGQVYGVYAFLDRYAGCRWYAPDTERMPDLTGWKIPDIDERRKPAIPEREMYVGGDYMDGYWRLRNLETMRVPFGCTSDVGAPGHCHTFAAYHKAIAKDLTPEMYGVDSKGKSSGQFCLSHPEVHRLVAEQMKKYIRSDRAACVKRGAPRYAWPRVYELSQDDGGGGGCYCPRCKALTDAAGSQSGPNIFFASEVAKRVEKDFPEVVVRTFAYSYTEIPPTNSVRAADNISVRYCRSFLFQPLVPDTDNGRMLKEWDEHARLKHVWGYWRTFAGQLFPAVKPRCDIGRELAFCRDMNVYGYFAENEAPLSRSFAMMQHWLFLKLAVDPDLDVYALSDEFIRAYYGAAARPMTEYLRYLEKRQLENYAKLDRKFLLGVNSGNLAQYVQREYLDVEFFRTVNAFLDEAERLAAGDKPALLHVGHERLVVDRTIRSVSHRLIRSGYKPDFAAIAKRTERTLPALIGGWTALRGEFRKEREKAVERELALVKRAPAPLPAELEGREVWAWEPHEILSGFPTSKTVTDPEASCGVAVRYPIAQEKHRLPFVAGAYGNLDRVISEVKLQAEDIPQDGRYHVIRLGKIRMLSPARVYFDWTWRWSTWLPTIGIKGDEREVWASVKFLGPVYVKGSKDPNEVRFDRLFFVTP